MTFSPQQQQTLEYFSKFADDWRSKAANKDPKRKFNVIKARNDYVLDVTKAMGSAKRGLDIGCGTGELVVDWGKMGIQGVGVDFAPDMIKLCKEMAEEQKIPNVEFIEASIFEYTPEQKFDVIGANGFIEYVSLEEFGQLLKRMPELLNPGGSFVVGSRNRLFNVFSLNEFTEMELKAGAVNELVEEATLIAKSADMQSAVKALEASPASKLPVHTSHPSTTGIEVAVRHQYTPKEIIHFLRDHGMKTVRFGAVHQHAFPPRFKESHLPVHIQVADLLQSLAWDQPSLVPSASTFMVEATMA